MTQTVEVGMEALALAWYGCCTAQALLVCFGHIIVAGRPLFVCNPRHFSQEKK